MSFHPPVTRFENINVHPRMLVEFVFLYFCFMLGKKDLSSDLTKDPLQLHHKILLV